jgi:endonuclease/exonuclease/phosphatase family metal-dependent hydrolase
MTLRVATYNAMNLFSRARPLAVADWPEGRPVLEDIVRLQDLLSEKRYSPAIKTEIAAILKRNHLANRSRRDDQFRINQVRNRLYTNPANGKIRIQAAGRDSWLGWVEPVQAILQSEAILNTARVVEAVDADILGLVEVEDLQTLERFHDDILVGRGLFTEKPRRYRYSMLVDGNDERGIDVGLYSRLPIGYVYSHIHDTFTSRGREFPIFSRDCPEYEVQLPSGDSLWVLVNHFKSKGFGTQKANDRKRRRQSERVAEILAEGYDLTSEFVVVAGDFNDTPDSAPLQPLLRVPHLRNVLDRLPPEERWTFRDGSQIDYLLVSEPLFEAIPDGGVGIEHRGIFRRDALGKPDEMFPEVKGRTTQASDHAALWVDFEV